MIRFVAVDDDPDQLKTLLDKLSLIPQLVCLSAFSDPIQALDFIQEQDVTVVFLDIEMPGLSGLDLARQLSNPPLFVFITSHPRFAAATYELDAVDYIVKPVNTDRLLLSVRKILKWQQWIDESSAEWKTEGEDFIFIKDHARFVKIPFHDIIYVESQNNFVMLHLENQRKQLVLVNMKHLEEQLPDSVFLRISRTHMVNKSKVTSFDHETIFIGKLSFSIGATYSPRVNERAFGGRVITRYKT